MFRKITIFGSFILIAALGIFVLIILLPHFFGWKPHIVSDKKMSPTYTNGSLIFVKKADPKTILVGETITYYESFGERVVTRRVVAVDKGHQAFYVKGDQAKQTEATAVRATSLIGQPIFQVPYIGHLLSETILVWLRRIFFITSACLMVFTSWNALEYLRKSRREEKTAIY